VPGGIRWRLGAGTALLHRSGAVRDRRDHGHQTQRRGVEEDEDIAGRRAGPHLADAGGDGDPGFETAC
jgi:hypothetical protein